MTPNDARLHPRPDRRLAIFALATAAVASVLLPGAVRAGTDAAQPDDAQPVAPAATLIGPDELARTLDARDPLLINVHIPYEGEIAGTDAFIPFDAIDPAALPADKGAEIVLYCRSGRMSAVAARTLADLGYTRVSDLDGGMNAWVASGRALAMR